MSEKYLEDNKKPSIFGKLAPTIISVGSIATAVVITSPGITSSLGLVQQVENDSQSGSEVDAITADSLPALEPNGDVPQQTTTADAGQSASTPAQAEVSTIDQPALETQNTAQPTTETNPSVETVVVETPVPASEPVPVAEPTPVTDPAPNASSATWVADSGSSETVIDQGTSATATENNSSATPYYDDDDDDDYEGGYDYDGDDDDHDDDDDDYDDDHDDHDDEHDDDDDD